MFKDRNHPWKDKLIVFGGWNVRKQDMRTRHLKVESLEERTMLSVTSANGGEDAFRDTGTVGSFMAEEPGFTPDLSLIQEEVKEPLQTTANNNPIKLWDELQDNGQIRLKLSSGTLLTVILDKKSYFYNDKKATKMLINQNSLDYFRTSDTPAVLKFNYTVTSHWETTKLHVYHWGGSIGTQSFLYPIAHQSTVTYTVRLVMNQDQTGHYYLFNNNLKQIEYGYVTTFGMTKPANSVPSVPDDITVSARTSSSITLEWNASNATSYTVQQLKGTTWSTVTAASKNSCTITGLSSHTDYKFRVAGTNANGTSQYSPTLTAKTATATGLPVDYQKPEKYEKSLIDERTTLFGAKMFNAKLWHLLLKRPSSGRFFERVIIESNTKPVAGCVLLFRNIESLLRGLL